MRRLSKADRSLHASGTDHFAIRLSCISRITRFGGQERTMGISKSAFLTTLACAAISFALVAPGAAAPRHHRTSYASGVRYDHSAHGGGSQALVSDGPGTGFGFHRLPQPYRFAAAVHRDRQTRAVREAVVTDALTNGNGPYGFGLPGDSVYGYGNGATYGVFSGADGYGSPYFAGFYGPGDGADLGVLGHAYN